MSSAVEDFDIVIIGGGIAGLSLAALLPANLKVAVIERETQPGFHATGRSAALYSDTYGSPVVRALSRASYPFLAAPPAGFAEHPLLKPRGVLLIGGEDRRQALADFAAEPDIAPRVRMLDGAQVLAMVPILRPEFAAAGVLATSTYEVEVNALQNGFLRQARQAGVKIVTNQAVSAIEQIGEHWHTRTTETTYRSAIVVNAAGAWAGEVAVMAGARPLGLTPFLRTAALIAPPEELAIGDWPMVVDFDETFYFKPDAGLLLISPADEEASEPCDAQPDEYGIAVAVDRIETATTLSVRRIQSKWAGLRTFAPDREPVIGFDPSLGGFFWLAGQGGYGIQACHAMALLAATELAGLALPAQLADAGIDRASVSPARYGLQGP